MADQNLVEGIVACEDAASSVLDFLSDFFGLPAFDKAHLMHALQDMGSDYWVKVAHFLTKRARFVLPVVGLFIEMIVFLINVRDLYGCCRRERAPQVFG